MIGCSPPTTVPSSSSSVGAVLRRISSRSPVRWAPGGRHPNAVNRLVTASKRDAGAAAQEAHELGRLAAELDEPREEAAGGDVGLAEVGDGDEVLALEVLDQRVVAVEPGGW